MKCWHCHNEFEDYTVYQPNHWTKKAICPCCYALNNIINKEPWTIEDWIVLIVFAIPIVFIASLVIFKC